MNRKERREHLQSQPNVNREKCDEKWELVFAGAKTPDDKRLYDATPTSLYVLLEHHRLLPVVQSALPRDWPHIPPGVDRMYCVRKNDTIEVDGWLIPAWQLYQMDRILPEYRKGGRKAVYSF